MDILLAFKNLQANARFSALYKTDYSCVTQEGKKTTQKKARHLSQGGPPVTNGVEKKP